MIESPKEYDSHFMTWENRSFLEVISHTGAVLSLRVFINVWKHFSLSIWWGPARWLSGWRQLAAKPDDFVLILGTHTEEGESWLCQVVLWLTHTNINTYFYFFVVGGRMSISCSSWLLELSDAVIHHKRLNSESFSHFRILKHHVLQCHLRTSKIQMKRLLMHLLILFI